MIRKIEDFASQKHHTAPIRIFPTTVADVFVEIILTQMKRNAKIYRALDPGFPVLCAKKKSRLTFIFQIVMFLLSVIL